MPGTRASHPPHLGLGGRVALLAALLSAAASSAASAQLAPLGPEIRVDTLAGDQYPNNPRLGIQPDGSFEVAWDSGGSFPADVYVRHYSSQDSPTEGAQRSIAHPGYFPLVDFVAPTADGFDVLFRKVNDLRPGRPIFYRHQLDPQGVPDAGRPLRMGVTGTRWVWRLDDGSYLAGRIAYRAYGLAAQRLGRDGRPIGREFRLNTRPVASSEAVVFGLAEGGFVAVWSGSVGSRSVLRARRFAPSGAPLGPDFDVASSVSLGPTRILGYFVAVPAPAGGFAAVWETYGDGERLGFYRQVFDAAGQAPGPEQGGDAPEDVTFLWGANIDPEGRILVLEVHLLLEPIHTELQLQLLDRDGARSGPPQILQSAASGRYQEPFAGTIAWAGSSWLVAWAGQVNDGDPSAIFLRRFAGD